jgi:BMFP domain-containing protein YqiC
MTDFRFIDDLTRRLSEAMPPGMSQAREDLESHFRSILNNAFERIDLVTRDQFEAQSAVLERLQAKLRELENQLAELQQESAPEE